MFFFGITSFCNKSYITPFFYIFIFFILLLGGLYVYTKTGYDSKKAVPIAVVFGAFFIVVSVIVYLFECNVEVFGTSLIFFLFGAIVFLFYKKKLNHKNFLILLFILGFVLRFSMVLDINVSFRQHDVGTFVSRIDDITTSYDPNEFYPMYSLGSGHAGYIEYIFSTGNIPDFDVRNVWSFYNPPFFHIIAAIWLRFATFLTGSYAQACESIMVISLYCSIVIMIFSYKIFKLTGLKNNSMSIAMAIVVFSPALVNFSYNVNNDPMATMFMIGAVLYALEWYKNQNFKNILITAVFVGLGMMTKVSVWMVAPPIAFIFIYAFFKNIKSFKKYILQYGSFLIVSVPLALWYPLKNYLCFGIPLTYIQTDSDIFSSQGLEGISVFQRLFGIDGTVFDPPWFHSTMFLGDRYDSSEYNPLTALFKTSVFEEYYQSKLQLSIILGDIMLAAVMILGAVSFIAMIYCLFSKKEKEQRIHNIFFVILYFTVMISYYIFCFNYPVACTQHIRYAAVVIIIGALYLGKLVSHINEKVKKKQFTVSKLFLYFIYVVTFLFCCLMLQI